jgi:hypothetical protein
MSSQKNWRKVQNKFCLKRAVGGGKVGVEIRGKMAQTIYAHMNKYLKIKKRKFTT